ncbi:NADPH-dependent F420 reductase [Pseudonocardia sp. CA-107938]|uniref:NADPH-dependent F420 reductase n=1 Tax=Pseudonocardia sp. CA-107938 TaxID=3240021 RepID=UPI003D8D326E
MKIGIIGAGMMASVLAARWTTAGHEVMIGARDVGRAKALATRLGPDVPSGTLREAAVYGDAALLAIWPTGVIPALLEAGAADGTLAGRTLIDCNNPVETGSFTLTTGDISLAEQIARLAPGSRVVKAFNQCHADVWAMEPPRFDDRSLVVPIAGDDPAGKDVVSELVRDIGGEPRDIGPLHRARHLEAMAAVVIGLLYTGAPSRTVFNLVEA